MFIKVDRKKSKTYNIFTNCLFQPQYVECPRSLDLDMITLTLYHFCNKTGHCPRRSLFQAYRHLQLSIVCAFTSELISLFLKLILYVNL